MGCDYEFLRQYVDVLDSRIKALEGKVPPTPPKKEPSVGTKVARELELLLARESESSEIDHESWDCTGFTAKPSHLPDLKISANYTRVHLGNVITAMAGKIDRAIADERGRVCDYFAAQLPSCFCNVVREARGK